jgi:endoglucanase
VVAEVYNEKVGVVMKLRKTIVSLVCVAGLGALALTLATGASGASPTAHQAFSRQCSSVDNSPPDHSNPLGSTTSNPLTYTHLFREVPWQYGGDAANAIANTVGEGSLTHRQGGTASTWEQYRAHVDSMHLTGSKAFVVHNLEKIANYPQSHQFSLYTAGGSPDQIFTQVQNYICRMQRTDATAQAVITTYFIKHAGCNSGDTPNFRGEVDALKAAVGNFPALIFVEEDAIDTICWSNRGAVSGRAGLLKYEIDSLSQLPHALLYVEGGTSDAVNPSQAATVLNAADARKTRGFFLNDTHFNWSYNEINYGNQLSGKTGGLHFVVDTRGNGNGPKLNPNPVTQGIEELCNPSGRAIGPKPGPSDGRSYGMYSKHLDGFVWVTTPGDSTSPTCQGKPGHWANSGIFDVGIGLDFASHANDRIGPSPRYKSRPW